MTLWETTIYLYVLYLGTSQVHIITNGLFLVNTLMDDIHPTH